MKATHLPIVALPARLERCAVPESVEEAEAERRELVAVVHRIQGQLREHGRNVGDFDAWRTNAKRKLAIVHGRLGFLKDWIKQHNRDVNTMIVTIATGDDLDDPVVLVAKLRAIIIRANKARPMPDDEWAEARPALEAATGYVKIIAAERAEGER